jgi:hypothetical protein
LGGISQHSAYQPGDYDSNALDIMGGPIGWTREQNIELIQKIVDDLTSHLHEWSIRKILWKVRDHYGHAHIDFYPMIDTHRWCATRGVTPAWKYSDRHLERHLDPAPENGPYDGGAGTPPPSGGYKMRTVRHGMGTRANPDATVAAAQAGMTIHGFRDERSIAANGADGIARDGTEQQIKNFQQAKSLVIDGICGEKTWAEIDKE